MYIEYRKNNSNEWILDRNHKSEDGKDSYHTNDVSSTYRWYEFFGVLAGVRGDDQMYLTRGIPKDISTKCKAVIDSWASDGHTHSWITLEEFKKALKKVNIQISKEGKKKMAFYDWQAVNHKDYEPGYCDLYHYCHEVLMNSQVEAILLDEPNLAFAECRLVFFFDN